MKNKLFLFILILFLALGISVSANAEEEQNDVTYTININLPEPDVQDVAFNVTAHTTGGDFSKRGVVKSGETLATVIITNLPQSSKYDVSVEFDNHKYRNEYVMRKLVASGTVSKLKFDYEAQYSKEVSATVSLPERFVCDGDVEVELILKRYTTGGEIYIDSVENWTDSKIVTLNNENRSQEVTLYTQESTAMLFYKIVGEYDGLNPYGYYYGKEIATSYNKSALKITENATAKMSLLKRKNITVSVWRPLPLSVDNDIFAGVYLLKTNVGLQPMNPINDTQIPLIPQGERKTEFKIQVPEDASYKMSILNISGDDNLYDSYHHVRPLCSPAEESRRQTIGFSDDAINCVLLKCNNVSGTVLSEDENLAFTALAICQLDNGNMIEREVEVVDGKFNLKIPEDTKNYVLAAETRLGIRSYYVSDGVSTNNESEAPAILFEYGVDKEVEIEYIVQKPTAPFEITWENGNAGYFEYKNNSDYLLWAFDIYVAYYDGDGRILSIEKTTDTFLSAGSKSSQSINNNNHRIKEIKCCIWKKDEMTPLSNVCSVEVNKNNLGWNDLSVFTIGEKSAIINCEKETLSKAPRLIDGDLYISSADFEKLGYEIEEDRRWVYIQRGKTDYEFEIGSCFIETGYDSSYEISAPILNSDGLLIPVIAISELFEEDTDWYADGKILAINRPFPDIEYTDVYIEAIYTMHYRGVLSGDEDGVYHPELPMRRSEAVACFTRFMGYGFYGYEFECSDVPSSHWAATYIKLVLEEGLFELENNCFRPDEYITVEESVIAALKMMGKFSENYMDVARENGLFKNISEENVKRNITRAEFVQLLYNTKL